MASIFRFKRHLRPSPVYLVSMEKYISLLISCLLMVVAGTLSTYSLFSESLRTKFGLSISDINIIIAVGNTALYVSFLFVGPIYDRFGPRITLYLACLTTSLCYLFIWMTYQGLLAGNTASLSVYYFLGGTGSTARYS